MMYICNCIVHVIIVNCLYSYFLLCFCTLSTQQGGYVHATNLYCYYYYYYYKVYYCEVSNFFHIFILLLLFFEISKMFRKFHKSELLQNNPNSLVNKGSCWILLNCYCSITMLRELGSYAKSVWMGRAISSQSFRL